MNGWMGTTLAAALALCLLRADGAAGQWTVQGRVVDAETGKPIVGAVVSLRGTDRSARSGQAGLYTLTNVPTEEVYLVAGAPGYAGVTERFDYAGAPLTIVNFELVTVVGAVDEIVVEARRRSDRTRGQSVGRVEGDEPVPAASASELIRGGVPGAMVLYPSGQVGSGYEILVRGLSTLAGDREPLAYVDGVRLNPSQRTALLSGVRTPGSLDFIDPFTIERIEVLRGAAASARYGSEASGGVILIFTKSR